MTRQIQIRRGTTAQNENFTGAIGEITMDIDQNTLRVHDGKTIGGIALARRDEVPENTALPETYDFVIETNTTEQGWYRKYKSGWVEQGGTIKLATIGYTVNMPVIMANTNYTLSANCVDPNQTDYSFSIRINSKNINKWSGTLLASYQGGLAVSGYKCDWVVRGMGAIS